MLVLVLRMLRYWRMSGTVISLRARRNLSPIQVLAKGVNEISRFFQNIPRRPKPSLFVASLKVTIIRVLPH